MKASAGKYAYSLKTQRVKETDFPYHGEQVTSTRELLQFVHRLQDSDIEKFLILYLDAQNQLVGVQVILGTVNQAVVYPREVFKDALLMGGACAIILVHNHPSGHPKPSEADIRLTKTLQECAKLFDILVHDHLIVAGERFFSFREEGLM
ncbi:MAG TPA: JAB domain-containing protein [Syntrophales bacterium]|nr:JAB domain-containing protein [Syntrophales bacterium]